MRLFTLIALSFLFSCAGGEKENEQSDGPVKNPSTLPGTEPVTTEPVKAGPTIPGALTEEEMQLIGHQENNELWFKSIKEFNEIGAEQLQTFYRQHMPDAAALYQYKKERIIENRKRRNTSPFHPNVPAGWETPTAIAYDTELADVVYRYGDMDNLGYGWPPGFDPFSGANTPTHDFPFYPEPDDPPGTDRIMVISGYKYNKKDITALIEDKKEGYTTRTQRPYNLPEKLVLEYDLKGKKVQHALLQIFVDDFQPNTFKTKFRIWLNGTEAVWINSYLNELKQTGPIGKLLSLQVLPEFIPHIQTGKLEMLIDDADTDVGDGFAIDFVQLLINPKNIPVSNVEGKVLDVRTNKPIEGAFIKTSGAQETTTAVDGKFGVGGVPSGMAVIQAAKAGYKSNKTVETLIQGETKTVTIKLEPETDNSLQEQLEEKGKVELYGIYFDSDKAVLKPESESTLQKILALINNNPKQKLEIGGHTDSQGDDTYNLQLSEKRAQAVLQWLKEHKATTVQLSSKGYGETEPVADNSTETGRALNRRVEIKLLLAL